MRKKVFIPQPIAQAGEQYLENNGCEIVRGSQRLDAASMKEDIADCDAMILRSAKVTREILEAGKKLRIVARHGAGYDNLDVQAAKTLVPIQGIALDVAEDVVRVLTGEEPCHPII